MRRVAAKLVPKRLSFNQKQHRINNAKELLEPVEHRICSRGSQLVTNHGWMIMMWKPKTAAWAMTEKSAPNVEVFLTAFSISGAWCIVVSKEYYLQFMLNLLEAIRQKRQNLWKNKNWLLHHDNASAYNRYLCANFWWKTTHYLCRSHCILQICPLWLFLFPKLMRPMKGRR